MNTKNNRKQQLDNPIDESDKIVIELKNRNVVLSVLPFSTDVDVDDLLKIDFHNVMGEILTFPVLYNRICNLKADQENIVTISEMDFKVFEAQLTEEKQKKLSATAEKKPTIKDVETAVLMDSRYMIKFKALAEQRKNLGYLIGLERSAAKKIAFLE